MVIILVLNSMTYSSMKKVNFGLMTTFLKVVPSIFTISAVEGESCPPKRIMSPSSVTKLECQYLFHVIKMYNTNLSITVHCTLYMSYLVCKLKYWYFKFSICAICLIDLLKTVLGKNSFDKQRHEKFKISDRGIVSKFHDVRWSGSPRKRSSNFES